MSATGRAMTSASRYVPGPIRMVAPAGAVDRVSKLLGRPLRTYRSYAEETAKHGVLPRIDPLPRFEISQPGNILRLFERGGQFRPEVGIPNPFEDPGRPIRTRLSTRGLGTQNRTDPTVLGLQKTRLPGPRPAPKPTPWQKSRYANSLPYSTTSFPTCRGNTRVRCSSATWRERPVTRRPLNSAGRRSWPRR